MALLYMGEFYLLAKLYNTFLRIFYEYQGFELHYDVYKNVASIVIIITFAFITPVRSSVRGFYLNFLLTTYFVPSMVLYSYAGQPTSSAIIVWSAFATLYAVSAIPVRRPAIGNIPATTLMSALGVAVLSVVISYPLIGGLSNFNLNIAAVYEFRREAAAALPGVFGYLSPIVSQIVIPFCTAIALVHRRYGSALIFVALAVLQFGFINHKSALFAPFAVIGAYFFLYRFGRYSVILMGLLAALFVSLIDVSMLTRLGNDGVWGWYSAILVQRVLMVPALLDYHYIEFFSENVLYYWSSSRITLNLMQIPYDGITAPFVIGQFYFGNIDMSANTGFIGAGYAQAGILGVLIYSVGVGMILAIFESYGKYMGSPFTVSATIITAVNFTAADLLTLLLTHGLAILVLLLTLMCSPESKEQESPARRVVRREPAIFQRSAR